jgi:hypothetical protein
MVIVEVIVFVEVDAVVVIATTGVVGGVQLTSVSARLVLHVPPDPHLPNQPLSGTLQLPPKPVSAQPEAGHESSDGPTTSPPFVHPTVHVSP